MLYYTGCGEGVESDLIAPALLIEDEKIRTRYMAETGGFNFEISSCDQEIKWRV